MLCSSGGMTPVGVGGRPRGCPRLEWWCWLERYFGRCPRSGGVGRGWRWLGTPCGGSSQRRMEPEYTVKVDGCLRVVRRAIRSVGRRGHRMGLLGSRSGAESRSGPALESAGVEGQLESRSGPALESAGVEGQRGRPVDGVVEWAGQEVVRAQRVALDRFLLGDGPRCGSAESRNVGLGAVETFIFRLVGSVGRYMLYIGGRPKATTMYYYV